MKYVDFKARRNAWNLFSKVDRLGSFDFFTTIVSLDSLELDEFTKMQTFAGETNNSINDTDDLNLGIDQYFQLAKVMPLSIHEYTHFVDATSSLWGLRHLRIMNDAYLSDVKRGGTEQSFHKAKNFYDHIRSIKLPNYYTVIDSKAINTRPWRSELTLGTVFSQDGLPSSRGVVFSWFSNSKGDPLARSPISTISILEASAMAQEMLAHISLINQTAPDFSTVESRQFERRTLDHLYNHEITEYSVCAHILANRIGCTDIISAFLICASIIRLILNFPSSAFERLSESSDILEILGVSSKDKTSEIIVERIRDGLKRKDLGVLFFLLCNVLPEYKELSQTGPSKVVRTAIERLGIEYDFILEHALLEAMLLSGPLNSSQIKTIADISAAGFRNFQIIDFEHSALPFAELHLPPVFLGDCKTLSIFNSKDNWLANIDLEECFDELYKGQSWVEKFSEACL